MKKTISMLNASSPIQGKNKSSGENLSHSVNNLNNLVMFNSSLLLRSCSEMESKLKSMDKGNASINISGHKFSVFFENHKQLLQDILSSSQEIEKIVKKIL